MMKYLIIAFLISFSQTHSIRGSWQFIKEYFGYGDASQCLEYDTIPNGSCQNNCGSCFNPGARKGAMCPDTQSQGYFCPDKYNFACLDWTFGSKRIQAAELEFKTAHGDDVFFGVGSFGSTDPMRGLGQCFRMKVEGVVKDLIVQSINTGSDVQGNQFDLQMGDGGTGAFNWCAGSDFAMYPGDNSQWGDQYGGWKTRDGCKKLPQYPKKIGIQYDYDNLITLCEYSFDKKVRGSNGENPTILDLARVECPQQLYKFTQLKRNDDPIGFTFDKGIRQPGFPNKSVKCQSNPQDLSFCLTRMMDCRKPSAGFKDNIQISKVVTGYRLVQVCTQDGYSRLDNRCGCLGCYC